MSWLASCPRTILLFASFFAATFIQAQDPTPVIKVDNPPNTASQQAKHYVVLVSLDGFRYDYPVKYGAPHLLALATAGASAPDGMLPSFPSLTFPNHYTIVTGLYPEHHGIVGNSFHDPIRGETYSYKDDKTNSDGTWYGGTPLWSLAEQQGMRTASIFWPGSQAEIAGKRPSYYLRFDDKLDDRKRIDQIIAWLQLPPEQRPHFITLYYSNADHAGHDHGPDSEEVRAAVHHLDDMVGELSERLHALKLPIDLVIVADHGMVTFKQPPILLGEVVNLKDTEFVGPLLYPKTEADAAKLYDAFKRNASPDFTVYRRADVPAHLHFDASPRAGDPVIIPNGAAHILETGTPGERKVIGGHGFDPSVMPEMKAIFYAEGPDIKPGVKLVPFENINIYPWLADILDLKAPIVDGKLSVLESALADRTIQVGSTKANESESSILKAVGEEQPVKVGVGVTPPALLHSSPPKYTKKARKAWTEGTVLLHVRIEKDGHPSRVTVVQGLGMGLDESAVKSISQASFKPALQDGKPVVVEINVEVNFKLFIR